LARQPGFVLGGCGLSRWVVGFAIAKRSHGRAPPLRGLGFPRPGTTVPPAAMGPKCQRALKVNQPLCDHEAPGGRVP
jgi:hypothetical protein